MSSEKHPNLQLHKWAPTDYVKREEWNENFGIIDDKIGILKTIVVSVKEFGAKGDGVTDDTAAIQNAIDSFDDIRGGTLTFPAGTYLVRGTITVRKNVVLLGIAQFNMETNNAGINHNTVIIKHEPTVLGTDLFIGDTTQANGYLSGIGIKNMCLYGTTNSRYAVKIDKAGNLDIDRLVIANGFIDGIVCDGYIHSKISNCYINNMQNAPIRFTGAVSTTTVIEKCYLRGSKWAFIAEAGTCQGVVLNDCIFETCTDGGLDIHVDNKIFINNPYAENIPSSSSSKPIIQIGINGTPANATYPTANVTITGGTIAGCNFGIDTESSAFNCGKVASLTVIGTLVQRVGKLIITTVDTKLATMVGISEIQVTSTKGGIYNSSKVVFIGYNENNTVFPYLDVSQIRFNDRKKWKIIESYTQTDGDLQFQINGQNPLWLDANQNIRHQYTGNPGSVSQVDLYGPVPTPNFTGLGAAVATWAETLDSYVRLRIRSNDGKISTLGDLRGTTAERPTQGLYAGLRYFDTTLGKPIWYNGSNWVDATGATV
jgi:hypothetical protein